MHPFFPLVFIVMPSTVLSSLIVVVVFLIVVPLFILILFVRKRLFFKFPTAIFMEQPELIWPMWRGLPDVRRQFIGMSKEISGAIRLQPIVSRHLSQHLPPPEPLVRTLLWWLLNLDLDTDNRIYPNLINRC